MVNIIAVISISDTTISFFDSWDSFWASALAIAGPQRRPTWDRMRQSMDICEQTVAQMFNVPIAHTKNISAIFGNSMEAIRRLRLEDVTRTTLLDPNSKVVLQIKHNAPGGSRGYRIATIYAPQICHIVKTVIETVPPGQIVVNVLMEEEKYNGKFS